MANCVQFKIASIFLSKSHRLQRLSTSIEGSDTAMNEVDSTKPAGAESPAKYSKAKGGNYMNSFVNGNNARYMEYLFCKWMNNHKSVDKSWDNYFREFILHKEQNSLKKNTTISKFAMAKASQRLTKSTFKSKGVKKLATTQKLTNLVKNIETTEKLTNLVAAAQENHSVLSKGPTTSNITVVKPENEKLKRPVLNEFIRQQSSAQEGNSKEKSSKCEFTIIDAAKENASKGFTVHSAASSGSEPYKANIKNSFILVENINDQVTEETVKKKKDFEPNGSMKMRSIKKMSANSLMGNARTSNNAIDTALLTRIILSPLNEKAKKQLIEDKRKLLSEEKEDSASSMEARRRIPVKLMQLIRERRRKHAAIMGYVVQDTGRAARRSSLNVDYDTDNKKPNINRPDIREIIADERNLNEDACRISMENDNSTMNINRPDIQKKLQAAECKAHKRRLHIALDRSTFNLDRDDIRLQLERIEKKKLQKSLDLLKQQLEMERKMYANLKEKHRKHEKQTITSTK